MSERLEDVIKIRKEKLERIKQAGIDPYPSKTDRTHTNKQALDDFDSLVNESITLVGRVRSWRDMGKITFVHIEDGSSKIQVLFKEGDLKNNNDNPSTSSGPNGNNYNFLIHNFDIGDFIQVTGKLFKTKSGEKTLSVINYKLLSKSLLPLPSEHFGLHDEEIRLRKRYLDILMDPKAKELFVKKARFWDSMREFLVKKGFLHIDMPILEAVPGGAEAKPFITHHNALDRDFYLRISLELPLKKMLVAGFEKGFEICRIFRNEGIDKEHLQDYTQLEFYWAYHDYNDMMALTEKMYKLVIKKVTGGFTLPIFAKQNLGGLTTIYNGQKINWAKKWPKVDYVELFKKANKLDPCSASR